MFDIIYLNLPTIGGLTSTFGNRNILGMYLCFVIPASLIAVFIHRKTWKKYLHIIMVFIGLTALMLIRSRAAWLGISVSLTTLLLLYRHFLLSYIISIYKNKTVLIVAHRLSTVSICDEVVKLDKGKIIETGTHEELLSNNGKYKQLYNIQFGENNS